MLTTSVLFFKSGVWHILMMFFIFLASYRIILSSLWFFDLDINISIFILFFRLELKHKLTWNVYLGIPGQNKQLGRARPVRIPPSALHFQQAEFFQSEISSLLGRPLPAHRPAGHKARISTVDWVWKKDVIENF